VSLAGESSARRSLACWTKTPRRGRRVRISSASRSSIRAAVKSASA